MFLRPNELRDLMRKSFMSVTGQTVLVVELLFIMVVELREEDPAVGDGVISLEQDWSFCLDLGIGEGVEWLIMVPMDLSLE